MRPFLAGEALQQVAEVSDARSGEQGHPRTAEIIKKLSLYKYPGVAEVKGEVKG